MRILLLSVFISAALCGVKSNSHKLCHHCNTQFHHVCHVKNHLSHCKNNPNATTNNTVECSTCNECINSWRPHYQSSRHQQKIQEGLKGCLHVRNPIITQVNKQGTSTTQSSRSNNTPNTTQVQPQPVLLGLNLENPRKRKIDINFPNNDDTLGRPTTKYQKTTKNSSHVSGILGELSALAKEAQKDPQLRNILNQ